MHEYVYPPAPARGRKIQTSELLALVERLGSDFWKESDHQDLTARLSALDAKVGEGVDSAILNEILRRLDALEGVSSFTLSAAPSSVSVAVGASASTSVTATVTQGNAQAVAFSTSGLPAGLIASWSALTASTGVAVTLMFTATGAVAPGSYAVLVTGAGQFGSASLVLSVTVTGVVGNDFAMSASPLGNAVDVGGSCTFTAAPTVTSGSAVPVTLSVVAETGGSLPAGVTATASPSVVTPPATSTVTVSVSSGYTAASNLEPPSGQCFMGFHVSGSDFAAIDSFAATNGITIPIYRTYLDMNATIITPAMTAKAAAGKILHFAFENVCFNDATRHPSLPAYDFTNRGGKNGFFFSRFAAGGGLDAYLSDLATKLKTLPGQHYFNLVTHEADLMLDSGASGASGDSATRYWSGTPAQFAAAARYMRDYLVAAGVTNMKWCLVFSGWDASISAGTWATFWPGDAYVDWIGWDPYSTAANGYPNPTTKWSAFYNRIVTEKVFGNHAATLPLMLGEFARENTDSGRPAWLGQMRAALDALPRIRALTYFNSWTQYRMDDAASKAAFAAAVNEVRADGTPVFASSAVAATSSFYASIRGTAGSTVRSQPVLVVVNRPSVTPTVTQSTPLDVGRVDLELEAHTDGSVRTARLAGFAPCTASSGQVWTGTDETYTQVYRFAPKADGSTASIKASNTPADLVKVTLSGVTWTGFGDLDAGPYVLAGGVRKVFGYDVENYALTRTSFKLLAWDDTTAATIAASQITFEYRPAGGGGSARKVNVAAACCLPDGTHLLLAYNDLKENYGEGTGTRDASKHRFYLLDLAAYTGPYRAVDLGVDLTATWNDAGTTRALRPMAMCVHPSLPIISVRMSDYRGGADQVRHEVWHFYRGAGMTLAQALAQTSAPGLQKIVLPNGGTPNYTGNDTEAMCYFPAGGSPTSLLMGQNRYATAQPARVYRAPLSIA